MPCAGLRIDRYLQGVARELASEPRRLVVVMGSPAVDPDSLAGSLAYAYLLNEEMAAAGPGQGLVVPLVPIPREELRLRPEVLSLLEAARVPPAALVYQDRLQLAAYCGERLSVVLVDDDGRGVPPPLRERVVEILDHHAQAVQPPADLPAGVRRVIAPVGSACTLVAEQVFARRPGLLDRRLALLLLGPILLDTADLDPGAGRVTERDLQAAQLLRETAGAGAERLYRELREARTRLDGFSGTDLLRRDFKARAAGGLAIGISSIPLPAQDWLSREPDPLACLVGFARRRELDLLVVMFAFAQGGGGGRDDRGSGVFRRQLLLCAQQPSLYRGLLEFLRGLPPGLREVAGLPGAAGGFEGCRAGLFEQGEGAYSRKRLEPELLRFCGGWNEERDGR